MTFKSFLQLTVATLPLALAACADSASEIRARYGDNSWSAEELTSTPYDRGRIHFAAGRFGLAVKQFELAIGEDPNSVQALNGLAASFDQLRRFDLAERYYLRALNLEPENAQTLNNLGYSYLMQGRHDLALAHLQDALAYDPMNEMVRDNLQQAEASLEFDSQNFLASAVGSADFIDVANAPRSLNLQTRNDEEEAPGRGDGPSLVQIEVLAARDDIWVERSSSAVQTLVTRPDADTLATMRDAGLEPRVANYRNQAAVAALQTRPTPWQSTRVMIAEAMVERELQGAIRQDRLADDLSVQPETVSSFALGLDEMSQLSASVLEEAPAEDLADLPQLSAAVIETGVFSDARPLAASFEWGGEAVPDQSLEHLPQLSAALLEDAREPSHDQASESEIESLIRPDGAGEHEPFAGRTGTARPTIRRLSSLTDTNRR